MEIKNWREFQHYKDGRPVTWIKLYKALLDDFQWHKLSGDAAKLLVNLWLLASEGNGELPDNNEIAFRLRMSVRDVEKQLKELVHYLEPVRTHPYETVRNRCLDQEEDKDKEEEKEEDRACAPADAEPPSTKQPCLKGLSGNRESWNARSKRTRYWEVIKRIQDKAPKQPCDILAHAKNFVAYEQAINESDDPAAEEQMFLDWVDAMAESEKWKDKQMVENVFKMIERRSWRVPVEKKKYMWGGAGDVDDLGFVTVVNDWRKDATE